MKSDNPILDANSPIYVSSAALETDNWRSVFSKKNNIRKKDSDFLS